MKSFKLSVVKFLVALVTMLMLGTSTFAQVSVTLPSASGAAGVEKIGAITVDDLTGKNVIAFQCTLTYDKNVVKILGIDDAGTLVEGIGYLTVNADTVNGTLSVAWANGTALSGQGTLLKLKIKFVSTGTTTLSDNGTFKLNGGNPAVNVTAGTLQTAAVLIQGGSVSATAGDDIEIPFYTTEITADQNVLSYEFTAIFDPAVIEINNFSLESSLSADGSAQINVDNNAGTLTFGLSKGSYITGSGLLFKLTGKAKAAGNTELKFTNFKFNAGTPIAVSDPALIVVVEANVAPTLTLDPNQTSFAVNENETLTITLVGSDANAGDVLTYSAMGLPQGATLVNNVFTWKPSYDQAGAYSVTFKVTDNAGLSDSNTVAIVVNNVNRAPSFTAEIPEGQIVPVHNVPVPYEFIYKANDPDGDQLTFRLVSGPGEISATGEYVWIPIPSQAGKSYVLIVEVSDGNLTATSTRTIKASDVVVGVEEEAGMPKEYSLMQNYPNPFNPTTIIKFALPKDSHVKLSIYNVLGQEVATLVNGFMSAGYHTVKFDASGLNTGMYIYKIQADNFVSMKKMMYVK